MKINITNDQFKESAIKEVELDIKKNKYPCKINYVSKVFNMQCEWCNNSSRVIHIGVCQTKKDEFTRGHCNNGLYTIFEDKSFHCQAEWFVCGKCENS